MLKKLFSILIIMCLVTFTIPQCVQLISRAESPPHTQSEYFDSSIRGPNKDAMHREPSAKKAEELTKPEPPPMHHICKYCMCCMCGYVGYCKCSIAVTTRNTVSETSPDTTETTTETETEAEDASDSDFTVKATLTNFREATVKFIFDVLPFFKIEITLLGCGELRKLWKSIKKKWLSSKK